MIGERPRRPLAVWLLWFLVLPLASCELPKDPQHTLEQARGATLRVGAVDSPPYLLRTGKAAAGPEAELLRAFARSIDADIEWRWGALDEHMTALEAFELDVVAAGLTTASPWKKSVGFTRPWRVEGKRKRVLAVPPGENRILVALERIIESRRGERP
jgi:polar amino acid transport system substrate-binding protein